MRCAEAARLPETGEQTGAVITSEMIRSYLETLSRRGRSRNTVQMYGAKLRAFYHYLPSDKRGEEAPGACGSCIWPPGRRSSGTCGSRRSKPMSRFWMRSSWLPDGRRMRAIPSKRMFAIDIFSPRGVKEEKR